MQYIVVLLLGAYLGGQVDDAFEALNPMSWFSGSSDDEEKSIWPMFIVVVAIAAAFYLMNGKKWKLT